MTPPGRLARLGCFAAVALLVAACRGAPERQLPAGTLWAGDAEAARQLLGALEQLRQTPAALAAHELQGRLAGCRSFLTFCPAGQACSLASALTCQPTGELAARADGARGDASWVFAGGGAGLRLVAWGTALPAGGLRVRATVTDTDAAPQRAAPPPVWEALLPARRDAAPPVLSDGHALVHLRLRSDRGLAALQQTDSGGWAGKLFGLEAGLFGAMALEGTSELAVYEPVPQQLIPPLALAVHVRQRQAATTALEKLLAGVHARWGATRSPLHLGPYDGACLSDLNVLPELAPCYLATDRALVLGWNPLSLQAALMQAPPAPPSGGGSELVADLDRFAAADARLRASYAAASGSDAESPAAVVRYPWSRVSLRGSKTWGGGYELEALLAAPGAATGGARGGDQ